MKSRLHCASALVLVLGLLSLASSQYSCPVSNAIPVQLGKSAVVCLHFVQKSASDGSIVSTTTYAFNTSVDDFSAFVVKGLGAKFNVDNYQYVVAQFQNAASNTTVEMAINNPKIGTGVSRQVLSVVVNIDGGIFTAFTPDNANCGACDSTQQCDDATGNQCYDKSKFTKANDPRVYISWIGTDSQGNYMLSHTKRLSRFTQYSIGSIYNKAKNLVV